MKKISFFFILLLILCSFGYAKTSSSSINWLSKHRADTIYCPIKGDCELTSLQVDELNVSVINTINKTVTNINVNGTLDIDGNITVSGEIIQGGVSLNDTYVNVAGDIMTGPLRVFEDIPPFFNKYTELDSDILRWKSITSGSNTIHLLGQSDELIVGRDGSYFTNFRIAGLLNFVVDSNITAKGLMTLGAIGSYTDDKGQYSQGDSPGYDGYLAVGNITSGKRMQFGGYDGTVWAKKYVISESGWITAATGVIEHWAGTKLMMGFDGTGAGITFYDDLHMYDQVTSHNIDGVATLSAENLDISVSADIDKDLNVDGNSTINLIYGEMWMHNDSTNGATQIIPGSGTIVNISVFNQVTESGQILNGFTYTAGSDPHLTAIIPGKYKAAYSISFQLNTGVNNEFITHVGINGIEQDQTETHRKIATSGDVGNTGSSGFIDLVVGDQVTLQMANNDGSGNAGIHSVNLNLIRVGS